MKIGTSDIVQAFDPTAVGTRVLDKAKFMPLLEKALAAHDTTKDQQPGQHFVMLPDEALEFVSAGVGKHTGNAEDYIVRMWRGEPSLFLKREFAAKATGVACVVYSREAYGKDPEVTKERFLQAFPTEDTTHAIVAVLAFAGPKPPVGPSRFVHNFAGSNQEYQVLTRLEAHMVDIRGPKGEFPGMHADSKRGLEEQVKYLTSEFKRLQKLAGEVVEYSKSWSTVAD